MADDDSQDRLTQEAVTEWDGGISWIADPDEEAQRASHALQTDTGVWVVDPVYADGLDDRIAQLGEVTGVVVLHDRHTRDAEEVANRHDVEVYVPEWMDQVLGKLEAPPETVESKLPETSYAVHKLIANEEWEEALLVDETTGTMVVPEAIGTLPSFGTDDDALGVHPALEDPPRRLTEWSPDRILVGHGESVYSEATASLNAALGVE